jgi:hypothetical protein
MRRFRPSPSLAVSLLALFVALGGVGYSATGGTFILGSSNSAGKPTSLAANVRGPALKLSNTSARASATALGLRVRAGRAPFTVSAGAGKVAGLDADKLDGLDAASFLPVSGTAADSDSLDGLDSSDFLPASGTAQNAQLLDSLDSSAFTQGQGRLSSRFATLAANDALQSNINGYPTGLNAGQVVIDYVCPADPQTQDGQLRLQNSTGGVLDVFADNGGASPSYVQVANTGSTSELAPPGGRSFVVTVSGPQFGVATIIAASKHLPPPPMQMNGRCIVHWQVTVTP